MKHAPRRKGIILVGVVFLMAIVMGLLSLLALSGGRLYRDQKADYLRSMARAMVDSGAAYVRTHHQQFATSRPAASLELDATQLLPTTVTGSLTISFPPADGHPACRVTAHVASASCQATDSLDISLPPPAPNSGR